MPGRIRPEFAVACASAFDAEGWWFTVDWSGMRALLFCDDRGTARLQDERLADRTAVAPGVIASARELGGRAMVLDGVLTVLDPQGGPDLAAMSHLLCGGASEVTPVFLVTDLLHLDASPVMTRPLQQRMQILHEVLQGTACIQLPECVAGEGIALATAAQQRGLAAVLARDAAAPYRAGIAAPSRLSVALDDRVTVVVAGVEGRGERVSALQLAEYVEGRLTTAGRCEVEFTREEEAWVLSNLVAHGVDEPSCDLVIAQAGTRWLRPHLCLTVTHLGRGPDGRLRGARSVALRDDVDPQSCVRRRPVDPPGDARVPSWRPTVLQGLPLDGQTPPLIP